MVLALIHSDVSAALNEYQAGHSLFEIYHQAGEPRGVPIGLANVVLRVLDMAAAYMIDIDAAMTMKMAYNRTRPRHGGNLT
jgi:hypothetical protein